jgi:hypothetical protein
MMAHGDIRIAVERRHVELVDGIDRLAGRVQEPVIFRQISRPLMQVYFTPASDFRKYTDAAPPHLFSGR